jgi:Putative Flp pilus-assembly TadE/G-like
MPVMSVLRRLVRSSSGGIAIMTAVLLPILIGMTALGVEVGHWYLTGRVMQGAADSAAMSAAAEYIAQGLTGISYQTVGKNYAKLNGFEDAKNNVAVTICGPSDNRTICQTNATQIRAVIHQLQSVLLLPTNFIGLHITEPNIGASAAVSLATQTITTGGGGCVLALANAANAIQVRGNGNIQANCGISADGGRDQNVSGTPLGSLSLAGNAAIHVSLLTVAASTAPCPGPKCFEFSPSTTLLPASAIAKNTPTQAPAVTFPAVPSGVASVAVQSAAGGYTKSSTRTFTVVGGTFTFAAKFTATIGNTGNIATIVAVIDPGAYTVMPTNPVNVTADDGKGNGAKFTLTEGCFAWPAGGTPLPGRKYCSINLNGSGTTNFPAGSYYIAGGDANCMGFCVSSANATVTSNSAGVTFYLTSGEGAGTFGTSSYARVSMSSGSVSLCAPGTSCGTTCTGSCLLFLQNPNATITTSLDSGGAPAPSNTLNTFAGNGSRTLSGLMDFPNQTVTLQGNGAVQGCVGIVAKFIDVAGTPTFSNGCLPNGGIGSTTTTTTTFHLSQ